MEPNAHSASGLPSLPSDAALIDGACAQLATRCGSDRALATALGLTADQQLLAAIDPGIPARLDAAFAELTALPEAPPEVWLPKLREAYRAWGGTLERPSIALVDFARSSRGNATLCEGLSAAGHPTLAVDPDELEFEAFAPAFTTPGRLGRLRARGMRIDLVWRRLRVQELLDRRGRDHALVRAYRFGAVCIANSFRNVALEAPAVWAVLRDPQVARLFTPEQRDAIARQVSAAFPLPLRAAEEVQCV